jgi:hypothetical protein
MDSKISQLPSANKIYDGDLLVAVTGYDTEGSYPDNVKINCGLIRRDIVRLNEMIFLLSGFSGFYNSGNNTMTITTHQKEGNLIKLDYEPSWPYMQIISTTGLNITGGQGIGYEINNSFPRPYQLKNVDRVKEGSQITITNNNDGFSSSVSGMYNLLNLSYNDFYQSKPNQNLRLLSTASFKVTNIVFNSLPFVPGSGQVNDRKYYELSPLIGQSINDLYPFAGCDVKRTISAADFKEFEVLEEGYVLDSFTLSIGISGGGSSDFIKTIHSQPIVFKNRNGPNSNSCSEIYRSGLGNHIFNAINSIDPIIIQEPLSLFLNSSTVTLQNSLALCAYISNVRYARTYQAYLIDFCENFLASLVNWTTINTYASTNATIMGHFIKAENVFIGTNQSNDNYAISQKYSNLTP